SRTLHGRAATRGFPRAVARTAPRSVRRRPLLRPCACGGTPRAATPRRCDAPAWSAPRLAFPSPALLSVRVSLRRRLQELWSPPSFPRSVPTSRRRSLLGGVPRDGSPASTLVLRRSDFSLPIPPRFVAFAWRYRRYSAVGDD